MSETLLISLNVFLSEVIRNSLFASFIEAEPTISPVITAIVFVALSVLHCFASSSLVLIAPRGY